MNERYDGVNKVMQLNDPFYGKFLVDLNDVIFRHQNNIYDHLRFHMADKDTPTKTGIMLLFMANRTLDTLATHGVPEAYIAEPTPVTVEEYERDQIRRWEKELDV